MNKFLTFIVFVFFISCMSDKTTENNIENTSDTLVDSSKPKSEVFYQVPSPEDLLDFIKMSDLGYDETLLNPIQADKYLNRKTQEINIGVYSADLAYVIAFNEYQTVLKYLEPIRTLSKEIGIEKVINEIMEKKNTQNTDSLVQLANDNFYGFINYLENADREETLALILAGGWIESLYIILNSIPDYESNSTAIKLLADQKLTFEILLNHLNKYKDDSNVSEIIKELNPISDIFNKVKSIETKKQTVSNNNAIIVGGNKKLLIEKTEFESLKAEISKLRNQLTKN